VIRLRHEHPVLRRRHFFQGRALRGTGAKDVAWLKPDGSEMTEQEWEQNFARCLGMYLAGEGLVETDERGRRIVDSDFLVLFNAHHEEIGFTLPQFAPDSRWLVVLDTTHDNGLSRSGVYEPQSIYPLQGRSLALLQRQRSNV
jgi:glycogen operon protein